MQYLLPLQQRVIVEVHTSFAWDIVAHAAWFGDEIQNIRLLDIAVGQVHFDPQTISSARFQIGDQCASR